MRAFLVVTETAVALMLLVSAGLLLKSFARLQDVDPGFSTENVLTTPDCAPRVTVCRSARDPGVLGTPAGESASAAGRERSGADLERAVQRHGELGLLLDRWLHAAGRMRRRLTAGRK